MNSADNERICCPNDVVLEEFLGGDVDQLTLAAIANHLESCPGCIARLNQLSRSASPLEEALRWQRPEGKNTKKKAESSGQRRASEGE